MSCNLTKEHRERGVLCRSMNCEPCKKQRASKMITNGEEIIDLTKQYVDSYINLFYGELVEFVNQGDERLEFNHRLLVANRIVNGISAELLGISEQRFGKVMQELLFEGVGNVVDEAKARGEL